MSETKQHRGFAAMSPEQRREVSRKGGRAAHAKGTGHQWTVEEAREAGRKGGKAVHGKVSSHDCNGASSDFNVFRTCRRRGCSHYPNSTGLCRCHREAA